MILNSENRMKYKENLGRHAKKYQRRQCILNVMLLVGMVLSLFLHYIGQYFALSDLEAGRQLSRIAVLKSVEFGTHIYDPFRTHKARLRPDDWAGWPLEALQPQLAIEKLQTLKALFKHTVGLNRAIIWPVDDRAEAFAFQPDVVRLRSLRERVNLPNLVDSKASQLTKLAVLNNWVRRQWIHGTNSAVNFQRFDAIEILHNAKMGASYSCQIASLVFAQAAASWGYQARLLSLTASQVGGPEHAVAEVWIDDLDKWVVFDTDFNLYYVNKLGVPLNALELHQALLNGTSAEISVVKGEYRPENFDVEEARQQPLLLPYYRYFYVDMRNDWMTNAYFPGHPKRSDRNTLRWRDMEQIGFLDLKPMTSDRSALYWPLNRVEVRFDVESNDRNNDQILVFMKTITPNFDRFDITINSSVKISSQSSRFIWHLKPGVNTLTIMAVNTFGIEGRPTHLEIIWHQLD
jgi:hypothetical protein